MSQPKRTPPLTVRELVLFAMFGALMAVSDLVMNVIPNVHLVGVLIVVLTVVYRQKALYPIFVYVLLIGSGEGFGTWLLPYLYVWPALWGMVMLLPRRMPKWLAPIVYSLVCALHGFAFGLLWMPSQMILMHFSWDMALVWWANGFFTADVPHGIGNLVGSLLIVPLVSLIRRLENRHHA